jgi:hypothetical protein
VVEEILAVVVVASAEEGEVLVVRQLEEEVGKVLSQLTSF